jgi:phosphoglycerol transferase MdoB-like AlkP superfamily enzyme
MLRRILIAVSLLFWITANLLFFYWYHRLLDLQLSLSSAAVITVLCAWLFSIAYFFPRLPVRIFLTALVAVILSWTLANFAYFKVFDTFLPLFSSRLKSINLPMIRTLTDFVPSIPLALALAALALVALFFLISSLAKTKRPDELAVVFSSNKNPRAAGSLRIRYRKISIVIGLATQLCAFFLMRTAIADVKRGVTAASDDDNAVAKIGLIGFELGSDIGPGDQAEESAGRLADVAIPSLATAKANVQTLRESIAGLNADAASDYNPNRPAPPKTPHVIFYQMESADAWPLNQDPSPMPFLASLLDKYGTVQDYFANGCTTIDAEFAINCGFLPETYGPVSDLYSKNSYSCLPSILKNKGYDTSIYHADDISFWSRETLAPAWGFDHLNFSPTFQYREPDSLVLDRVVDDLKAASKPTFQYVIGYTAHAPHNKVFQKFYNENYHLGIEPYAGELNASSKAIDLDEPTLRMYLGFLKASDDGLKHLFDRLTQEGLLDQTVVVIYGDHRYYQADSGDPENDFLLYNRIPLVIAMPGADKAVWPKIASHDDIAPTIFDYLTEGKETLPPTFLGTSLFSPDHKDGAVNKCLGRVSYWNGSTLASGNLPLHTFKVQNFRGTIDDAAQSSLKNNLLDTVATSDLLFARNSLGGITAASEPATPTITPDAINDSDHDGLSDMREQALGTDPYNPDTDGDGFSDGEEVMNGFNPLGPGKQSWESETPTQEAAPPAPTN